MWTWLVIGDERLCTLSLYSSSSLEACALAPLMQAIRAQERVEYVARRKLLGVLLFRDLA